MAGITTVGESSVGIVKGPRGTANETWMTLRTIIRTDLIVKRIRTDVGCPDSDRRQSDDA